MIDMEASHRKRVRARSRDEIMPLIDLCKRGHLFEVQEWIAAGKPVNLPYNDPKCQRLLSPLEIAIDNGFHSLVAVLLEGGAIQEPEGWGMPVYRAIRQKRMDLIELMVAHGLDMSEVDMHNVFDTWEPAMMEYFIEKGADPEANCAMGFALCERIRTALRIYKKYKDRFPGFQEQANIALRHHSAEGNLKWISLMLWLGADPYAPGRKDWEKTSDDKWFKYSAVGFAAYYGNLEAFDLLTKKRYDADHPDLVSVLMHATTDKCVAMVAKILEKGVNLAKRAKKVSSILQGHLTYLDSCSFWDMSQDKRRNLDTEKARNVMKAIYLLAKHGVRWRPDAHNIKSARRTLLKMAPDYTAEFVWIMSKYKACKKADLVELLRTPGISEHVSMYGSRIRELLAAMGEGDDGTTNTKEDNSQ